MPITSNLSAMTTAGLFNFCRTASEMELYMAINACRCRIRRNTAKGFFLNRFGYMPVCVQLTFDLT